MLTFVAFLLLFFLFYIPFFSYAASTESLLWFLSFCIPSPYKGVHLGLSNVGLSRALRFAFMHLQCIALKVPLPFLPIDRRRPRTNRGEVIVYHDDGSCHVIRGTALMASRSSAE